MDSLSEENKKVLEKIKNDIIEASKNNTFNFESCTFDNCIFELDGKYYAIIDNVIYFDIIPTSMCCEPIQREIEIEFVPYNTPETIDEKARHVLEIFKEMD